MPNPDREAHGHNPLCGDRWTVALKVSDNIIRDVKFNGSGCAISKASASLMTEAVRERSVDEALLLFDRLQAVLTTPMDRDVDVSDLGKLSVFTGVREFPMRVKCASLAWHTLKAALAQQDRVVKTE
jgi:nitrogen fixation NifU-like protein